MRNFKYRIHIGDTELTAKPLDALTIDSLLSLIEDNVVNAKNHKRLFGEEGEPEFETTGALFHTSKEQMYAIMRNPELYLSVVVVDSSNHVIGFIDTQLEDVEEFALSIDELHYIEGLDDKRHKWKKAINAGKATFKGDMVIDESNALADLFYVIIYILFQELIAIGKTISIVDIISITGYKYNEKAYSIDIYNRRSFLAQVLGLEACYVADSAKSILRKDGGLEIEYYEKLIEHDIFRASQICHKAIAGKNISIKKSD